MTVAQRTVSQVMEGILYEMCWIMHDCEIVQRWRPDNPPVPQIHSVWSFRPSVSPSSFFENRYVEVMPCAMEYTKVKSLYEISVIIKVV